MTFSKLPIRYDEKVVDELRNQCGLHRVSTDPILQALDTSKLWSIQKRFSKSDLDASFRNLALEFHPDRNQDKTIEVQRRYALFFGKIFETYRSLIDLQAPQIPFAITGQYKDAQDFNRNAKPDFVLKSIFPIPLSGVNQAEIWKKTRDLNYRSANDEWTLENPHTIIKNPEEIAVIKAFADAEKNGTTNEDLEDVEYALSYGFRTYPADFAYWCPHDVAIKHLERAKAFYAEPNEWVVIDKELTCERGFIKEERKNELFVCGDEIRELVSIEPSTVTMKTKKGGMFVAKNPYHKYLMPKGDILVPIEDYVDAKTTQIALADDRDLPIPVEQGNFMRLRDYEYGEHLPWTHLSPDSVEILRD